MAPERRHHQRQRIVRAKQNSRRQAYSVRAFHATLTSSCTRRLSSDARGYLLIIFNGGYPPPPEPTGCVLLLRDDAPQELGRIVSPERCASKRTGEHHRRHCGIDAKFKYSPRLWVPCGGRLEAHILLLDQNRALWDHLLIRRGVAALERAETLKQAREAPTRSRPPSPPVMREPRRPTKPTGSASPVFMRSWQA